MCLNIWGDTFDVGAWIDRGKQILGWKWMRVIRTSIGKLFKSKIKSHEIIER